MQNITFIMIFFFIFKFWCVICCLNTRFSIYIYIYIYKFMPVNRHSSDGEEWINPIHTISNGKYCFSFRKIGSRTLFWKELCTTTVVLAFVPDGVSKINVRLEAERSPASGLPLSGGRAASIAQNGIRLPGLVQDMYGHPCRTQVSRSPVAYSSGSHCTTWANDQHKSDRAQASARARPPTPLTRTISRPCVMTLCQVYLMGGRDKHIYAYSHGNCIIFHGSLPSLKISPPFLRMGE